MEDDLNLPVDLENCIADDDLYNLSLPFVSLYKASTFEREEGRQTNMFTDNQAARKEGFQEG